ncbi:hypothetical protein EON65_04915 [archaeon]|nr:MAG: hypothetical protein EON65_04915 [archaeon]
MQDSTENHIITLSVIQDEVKAIVKKRTDYEYMMMRFELKVDDLQGYLDYEQNLDRLVEIRMKKLLHQSRNDKNVAATHRNIRSEFIKHVKYIYTRGIRKFSDNFDLYMRYVRYLQTKDANNLLDGALGQALALHPKHSFFYVQAALHELNFHQNVFAARVLLQRGLRACAQNEHHVDLWKTYFNLEIWNYLRAVERYKALGLIVDDTSKAATRLEGKEEGGDEETGDIDQAANKLSVYNINKETVEVNLESLEKPIEVLIKYATRQLLDSGHYSVVFDKLLQLSPISSNLFSFCQQQVDKFLANNTDKNVKAAYLVHQCKLLWLKNVVHLPDLTPASIVTGINKVVEGFQALIVEHLGGDWDDGLKLPACTLFYTVLTLMVSTIHYVENCSHQSGDEGKGEAEDDGDSEVKKNDVLGAEIGSLRLEELVGKYFHELEVGFQEDHVKGLMSTIVAFPEPKPFSQETVVILQALLKDFIAHSFTFALRNVDQTSVKSASGELAYVQIAYNTALLVKELSNHWCSEQSKPAPFAKQTRGKKATKKVDEAAAPENLASKYLDMIESSLLYTHLSFCTQIYNGIQSNHLDVIKLFNSDIIYHYLDKVAAICVLVQDGDGKDVHNLRSILQPILLLFMLSTDSFESIVNLNVGCMKILQDDYIVYLQQFFFLVSRLAVKHATLREVVEKVLFFYLHNSALPKEEYQAIYTFIMQTLKKKYTAVFHQINMVSMYTMVLEVHPLLNNEQKKRPTSIDPFYISVLQAASSDCPEYPVFADKLIEAYHKSGNHDKANHLQYVKRRKLESH